MESLDPTAVPAAAPVPLPTPEPQVLVAEPPPWPLILRILFRIAFVYELLFSLPFPIGRFAGMSGILVRTRPVIIVDAVYGQIWDQLIAWIGPRVFGVQVDVASHNYLSGDRLYDWVRLGTIALTAVTVGLVWSVVDFRRLHYRRLYDGLRVYVRMVVGISMLSYGLMKVFRGQLPFPYLGRMVERFGDASPMGLLWTTLGFSTPYVVFAGSMETLGGLLVFFRRTTTLGALMVVAVMTNVVMFNLCFDVPVKIYSANIVLMAVMLLLPDAQRLVALLVLHRPTMPRVERPADFVLGDRPRLRWAAKAAKLLFLAAALYDFSSDSLPHLRELYAHESEPAPFGEWQVVRATRDGAEIPLETDDPSSPRWLSLYHLGPWPVVEYTTLDGHMQRTQIQHDANAQQLLLPDRHRGGTVYTYALPDGMTMHLEGHSEGHPVGFDLHRVNLQEFPLLNRGFHWVNEIPFNR